VDVGILTAGLAIVFGVAACFAGQRLFGLLLALGGAVAGFAAGSTLATFLTDRPSDVAVAVAGVIGALVGALLVRAFFSAAVLLAFAAIGGWLGATAATAMEVPHLTVPAAALGAMIASVAAAILQAPRWLVVGATSVVGAAAIVVGGSVALGRFDAGPFAAAVASASEAVDPDRPLLVVVWSLLRGEWLTALLEPVDLIASQPVLVAAIAVVALLGVAVQAMSTGLVPRSVVPLRA
jgi:uncharacterized protein DUF4203